MNNISRNGRLRQFLIHIRSSLWFVPTLMILGATVLAIGLVEIDQRFDPELRAWLPWLFATEADGTRGMLATIAGSMATVAGVVFSITIVALALASSQYTSRVLRNFMRDRANQTVLGVFVGVYIYCLLVLRTISGGDNAFVPSLAVLGGVILAITAIGFFIFFIHHISSSIQASEIVAAITRETLHAIDRLFPDEIGEAADESVSADMAARMTWQNVPAFEMGYIQSVDSEALLAFARKHQTMLRMECGIGDFIAPGRPLVSLALDHRPDEATVAEVNGIYAIASYRTIDQDAAFGIRQLVDIALKALSPGINDTTTAVTCIEHLSALLSRCAQRCMAIPYRFDRNELRIIAQGPTFEYLLALSFSQILENAEANTEIMIQMLIAIDRIGQVTNSRQRIEALRNWAGMIDETAKRSARSGYALRKTDEYSRHVRLALNAKDPSRPA